MKAPAIRKPTRFQAQRHKRNDERGVTMVLVAVAMVAIVSIAALSIDVITLFLAREEAQRAADAAALTAAKVISASGLTGDPANSSGYWLQICGGGPSLATQAAQAVGAQNSIEGTNTATVSVTYGTTRVGDCSGLTAPDPFSVNPIVTVKVQRNNLPTFFSRIWGNRGNSVSATATAEAFNPSNSGNVGVVPGVITPVSPRCVKPWIVPNRDPWSLAPSGSGRYCSQAGGSGACLPFVDPAAGSIQRPGISLNGIGNPNGVIGEEFTLLPDCTTGAGPCVLSGQPQANYPPTVILGLPTLQYVPGTTSTIPTGVPSCASPGYQAAIAGCDQSTNYQCGVPLAGLPPGANTVDLTENPSAGDTATGVECLTGGVSPAADNIVTTTYPFQIYPGTANPLRLSSSTRITMSNSIVSLPIYDDPPTTINQTGQTQVVFVGFLQVFIDNVLPNGNVDVTVLNVAGCGNGTNSTASPVNGSSPVPVRLITAP
jgi:Flp pilus assembly protein TadG